MTPTFDSKRGPGFEAFIWNRISLPHVCFRIEEYRHENYVDRSRVAAPAGRPARVGPDHAASDRAGPDSAVGGGFQAGVLQPTWQAISPGQYRTPRALPHRCAPGPERAREPGRRNASDQGRGRRLGRHDAPPG